MLVNGKMQQKIPHFFSCLLKAFQLSNSMPPKRSVLNAQNGPANGLAGKSKAISPEKAALFKRLHDLFNLNKITAGIVKLLMLNHSSDHFKEEISKEGAS